MQNLQYEFDILGNLTKRTDFRQSDTHESFAYDPLNRLTTTTTTVNGLGGSQSTEYDDLGNLIRKRLTNHTLPKSAKFVYRHVFSSGEAHDQTYHRTMAGFICGA